MNPISPGTAFIALAAAIVIAVSSPASKAGDARAGAQIFQRKCARCHGASAKGDGPDLARLQSAVSPDDWNDKETNQEMSDAFIVSMITKGGQANGKSRIMPSFGGKLNDRQVNDLVAFIRSLPKSARPRG
jgi:mono/diheme cytochrome c family protein